MPIYDFRCPKCGELYEVLLLPSSPDRKALTCPSCGSPNQERLISVPSVSKGRANAPGTTCCGREERCQAPPCSTGEQCRRH